MTGRTTPTVISKILGYDATISKRFVTYILRYGSFKSLRAHCTFLEISCNGIAWLSTWMAFIWLIDCKNLYEMQLNMLIGLLLDIVVIAVLKAVFRRRRPTLCNDMLMIGPDKFSFPSGHASRSFFLLTFFIKLYPLSMMWWLPIAVWACSVSLSRLILQRHYVLDITFGMILGILVAYLLQLIWISQDAALGVINFISNDNLPGGSE